MAIFGCALVTRDRSVDFPTFGKPTSPTSAITSVSYTHLDVYKRQMLLYALSGIRSFYPVPFELVAIAVDLGYEDFDLSPVKALCDELSVCLSLIHI